MFPDEKVRLVLGGPGCGKTTRLLQLVEQEISGGVAPKDIAFVTFTRAAAEEAKARAAAAFRLTPKDDLPWFRTIHSLAHSMLGVGSGEVMDDEAWAEFASVTKYCFAEGERGAKLLRVVEYAATASVSLAEAARTLLPNGGIEFGSVLRFNEQLSKFKRDTGRLMYTDMLNEYLATGAEVNVAVAFIDEAQDLTALQWAVVERAFRGAERVYIGGDDDQAIYRWAGADVDHFLKLPGQHEVLPRSHRLPQAVYDVATRIARRITHRFPKPFLPTGRPGRVGGRSYFSSIDLSEGTWMLLARNKYHLSVYREECESGGWAYVTRGVFSVNATHWAGVTLWEGLRTGQRPLASAEELRALAKLVMRPLPAGLRETELYDPRTVCPEWPWEVRWTEALRLIPIARQRYYNACLRRGEPITRPRIVIDTIHGVKGGEADHVVLIPDMSRATWDGRGDDEWRVWYVGVTRARESLTVLDPRTNRFAPLGSLLFR